MTNFKPMLAVKAKPDKINYPVSVQPKLDGIRASVVNGKLVSRTLKEIPNREIFNALSKPEFEGLDGELIVGDPTADGCMQRTSSFVMAPNKTGERWTYHVFDLWNMGAESFTARLDVLRSKESARVELPGRAIVVPARTVGGADGLEKYESLLIEDGHEGVIIRDPNAPYKFGRASVTKGELLKLKRFIDFEAEILGVYEEMHNANEAKTNALGRTERSTVKANKHGKGTLGGFHLRAINGPAEGVEFRCGTGFNAQQRKFLWDEYCSFGSVSPDLLARIVKVKSFPIGVKDKPRFPVFLGFRDMEVDG